MGDTGMRGSTSSKVDHCGTVMQLKDVVWTLKIEVDTRFYMNLIYVEDRGEIDIESD